MNKSDEAALLAAGVSLPCIGILEGIDRRDVDEQCVVEWYMKGGVQHVLAELKRNRLLAFAAE